MTYYLEFFTNDGYVHNYKLSAPDDRVALRCAAIFQEGFALAGTELHLGRLSRKPSRGVEYKEI